MKRETVLEFANGMSDTPDKASEPLSPIADLCQDAARGEL